MLNPRFRRLLLAVVATAALSAAGAAAALAEDAPPPPPIPDGQRLLNMSFDVHEVDAAAHTITGVVHCVPPSWGPGSVKKLRVDQSLDMGSFPLHTIVGLQVKPDDSGVEVVKVIPPTCDVQPQPAATGPNGEAAPPPGFGPDGTQPGPQGAPGEGGPMDVPNLSSRFLNRVFKLEGSADGYADGVLNITLERVLNLPRSMRAQDDDLVDQDAMVLIGSATRVYDGTRPVRERREAAELAAAESVRVQGKFLKPSKWRKDEDDNPVTTIRAKKVYILG